MHYTFVGYSGLRPFCDGMFSLGIINCGVILTDGNKANIDPTKDGSEFYSILYFPKTIYIYVWFFFYNFAFTATFFTYSAEVCRYL